MDLINFTPKSEEIIVTLTYKGKTITNDDGTPMTITRYASTSKEYKKVIFEAAEKRLEKSKGNDVSKEDWEEIQLETLAKTTKSWNITWQGSQPEFTEALAKEVYSKVFWIKDQVEQADAENVNFTMD